MVSVKFPRLKNSRGFSLAEAVVVIAISGLVILGSASMISTQVKIHKTVDRRLSDVVSSEFSMGQLTSRLEQSSIMQTGLIDCTHFPKMTPNSNTSLTMNSDGDQMAFAFSTNQVFAVPSPDEETNTLALMNIKDIEPGNIVLITETADGTEGGFFEIVSANKATLRVQIAPYREEQYLKDIGCGLRNRLNLTQIFQNSGDARYLLSVVRFVHLQFNGTPDPQGRFDSSIEQALWPIYDGGARQPMRDVMFYNPVALGYQQRWEPDDLKYTDQTLSGRYRGRVTAIVNEVKDRVGAETSTAETATRSTYRSDVYYQLLSLKRQNVGVPTTALPMDLQFPTCSITAERFVGGFRRGVYNSSTRRWDYSLDEEPAIYYKLKGGAAGISAKFAPQLSVNFQPNDATSDIHCYQLNDPKQVGTEYSGSTSLPVKPDFFASGKLPMLIGPRGQSGSLNMPNASSSGVDFAEFICIAKGSVGMSASMTYFNSTNGDMSEIICTTDSITEPILTYSFERPNDQPSCDRFGLIDLGSQLIGSNGQAGPPLRVAGCYYDNSNSRERCEVSNSRPNRRLARVDIYPKGITINGLGSTEPGFKDKGSSSYEIVCN